MFSRVYVWKCCSHTNDTTPMATSAVIAAIRANEIVTRVVYERLFQLKQRLRPSASVSVDDSAKAAPSQGYCCAEAVVGSSKR